MVLGFRSAILYFFLGLVSVPESFAHTCIGNKCLCVEQIRIIDCSKAGLEYTPQTKETMLNYTTLTLRYNRLVEVNFTLIMEQFPSLRIVDLRNNPIDCEGVGGGESIKVIMDCNASRPTKHHRIATTKPHFIYNLTHSTSVFTDSDLPSATISSTTKAHFIHNLTHPTSAFKDSDLSSTVYLTALIASIISIPFIILCLRIIIKLLIKRRRRQRNIMHSFEMISFDLQNVTDESDEQVIFDVTSL